MKVNFEKLKLGNNNLSFDIPSSDIIFDYKGYALNGNWHMEANFDRNSRGEIAVKGDIKGNISLICDRCLEEFERELDLRFEYFLIPFKEDVNANEDIDEEINDSRVLESFYKEDFVKVEDIIREQIILGLPDKVLCSEDCKGILKEDGTPYVSGGSTESLDQRLLPLLEIKKKLKK